MSARPEIFLIRHGETEWSRTGKHTGRTEIPLNERGRDQAARLAPLLRGIAFERVLVSPLGRARETAALAGMAGRAEIDPDLAEWAYGRYEGLTLAQIRESVPGWTNWTHPCPGGESLGQVAARADAVIGRLQGLSGRAALFSHGHFLRVFAARWMQFGPEAGQRFALAAGTISRLGYEHEARVMVSWNQPGAERSIAGS